MLKLSINRSSSRTRGKEYLNFLYYSDGEYPEELIDKQRPNRHDVVKKYRKETYQPVFVKYSIA